MFFGELIGLYLQGFFEFLIAAILTTKKKSHEMSGEILSLGITYFSFFILCAFLPIACCYVIYVTPETLQEESFKNRWGELYQNMYEKREDRGARLFYLLYVLRRITFILMCFLL